MKWDDLKRTVPQHERCAMTAVERMTADEIDALIREYREGDRSTQARLETKATVAAVWKALFRRE